MVHDFEYHVPWDRMQDAVTRLACEPGNLSNRLIKAWEEMSYLQADLFFDPIVRERYVKIKDSFVIWDSDDKVRRYDTTISEMGPNRKLKLAREIVKFAWDIQSLYCYGK